MEKVYGHWRDLLVALQTHPHARWSSFLFYRILGGCLDEVTKGLLFFCFREKMREMHGFKALCLCRKHPTQTLALAFDIQAAIEEHRPIAKPLQHAPEALDHSLSILRSKLGRKVFSKRSLLQ